MASSGHPEASRAHTGGGRLPEGSRSETDPVNMPTSNLKMSRKRTKTGCLTCRKRRIKCGEERPICNNCVKSKRNCEGYNQRVVFKDPMNAFRPTGTASQHGSGNGASVDQLSMQGGSGSQYGRTQSASFTSQAPLPAIAPRPSYQEGQSGLEGLPVSTAYSSAPDYSFTSYDPAQIALEYPLGDLPPRQGQLYASRYCLTNTSHITPEDETVARTFPGDSSNSFFQHNINVTENGNVLDHQFQQLPPGTWPQSGAQYNELPPPYTTSSQTQFSPFQPQGIQATPADVTQNPLYSAQYHRRPYDPQRTPTQRSPLGNDEWVFVDPENQPVNDSAQSVLQRSLQNGWLMDNGRNADIPAMNGRSTTNRYNQNIVPQQLYQNSKSALENMQPLQFQHTVPVEEPEDDYYDADSDGEMGVGTREFCEMDNSRTDLGLMLALSASQDDMHLRSFTTFLNEPNVLATYQPSATASPLMDPQTARVFCHFVTSTGPALSIFERHPTNPSVMFTGAPVPASQQALWTYTLPTLALTNQGLLHSMLALASLHIAKLQHSSPTPSLKHYHYALRRVAKAVGLPSRRQEIATLAASLLLGFYEVMTAEHTKWSSHLAGARQLVMEIDFAGMTKQVKAMKAQSEVNRKPQYYGDINRSAYEQHYSGHKLYDDVILEKDSNIDENLVSTIIGWKIRYDRFGHVIDNSAPGKGTKTFTAKDLEKYKTQCDLFWWYCKQDVYQSMISGNRLLMPYDRWGYCPPRAPIGKLDAIYGSMDHLVLLMGRVAEFGAKDQRRKREAVKANGGVWRPPPGMFPGAPPTAAPQSAPSGGSGAHPSGHFGNPTAHGQNNAVPSSQFVPPMYGMAPSMGPRRMPDAFVQGPTMCQSGTTQYEDIELEAATIEAEMEWNDIRNAFEVFEESLGRDFEPLSPEYMQPLSSPFGPALYYRTYSIACIWGLYYTGRILTARVHPSMPPAAMVAAGVAASQTKGWAKLVGRVAAGLQPTNVAIQINPSLGAALIESSLGLFFAGIQYQDAGQRGWTITKLRDIARLTGWQSSAAIASGCETAWAKSAEAGKGPPYQRTMDPTAKDDRVAGRRPDLNGGPPKDNNDRRFVTINPGTRVHWALGLLSVERDVEEDMRKLTLDQ